MKPKEYFALALRIIGILIIAYGIRDIVDFGLGLLGYFILQRTTYSYLLIIGIAYLFVGLYFLRGASLIVRFAYPEKLESESNKSDSLDRKNPEDDSQ